MTSPTSTKISKQGNWAAKLTKEERSRRMSLLAKRKHAKLTKAQRVSHSLMMVKARLKKKHTRTSQKV